MTMAAPGMASGYSAHSHPDPFEWPPLFYSINHIMTTGWRKPTVGTKQRGKGELVQADGPDEEFFKHYSKGIIPGTLSGLKNGVVLMVLAHPNIHDVTLIFEQIK